jgi:hypothetical protein
VIDSDKIVLLKRRLLDANKVLRSILPAVKSSKFTDARVRDAVVEAESLTWFKDTPFPPGMTVNETLSYAQERARVLAKEKNKRFLVVEGPNSDLIIVPHQRYLEYRKKELADSFIIFDTEKA